MANVFSHSMSLNFIVTLMTQSTSAIFNETTIGEFQSAHLATETIGMPAGVHGLNHLRQTSKSYELLYKMNFFLPSR